MVSFNSIVPLESACVGSRFLCGKLLCILGLAVRSARLPVRMIDSCSQTTVYSAQVLLVIFPFSGEGQVVIENRNAD